MITVLFFAHLKELVGKEKITLDIAPISIKELKNVLANSYNLSSLDNNLLAINEEYGSDSDIVNNGDIVAVIPPVSGG